MICGETVTVLLRRKTGEDRYHDPVWSYEPVDIQDVIVAPGPTKELEAERPEGARVVYTLHFPKTFSEDLTGARVSLRGEDPYEIVGTPRRYTSENTPGRHWLAAEVVRVDG